MANRYWVGGAGTWDTTSTTNWSATSGGAAGASAPTSADAVLFDANSGSGTVTVASGVSCLSISLTAASITVQMTADMTIVGRLTLNAGTFDINNSTITLDTLQSASGSARTLAFGSTGKINCATSTSMTFGIDLYSAGTTTTVTGTGTIEFTAAFAGTTGFRSPLGAVGGYGITLNVKNGSGPFNLGSGFAYLNIDFTGFSGTLGDANVSIYGNLTFSSTMTVASGTSAFSFLATSGTQQLRTNGLTIDRSLTVNAPGATVQLIDNATFGSARTATLTAGTLNLDGKTLSVGIFSSSNSNTRTVAFGASTGAIVVTGNNAAVFNIDTPTNLTVSGTPVVRATYSGATGARTFSGGASIGEARAFNLAITAGTDSVAFSSASARAFKNVDFTGFSGTYLTDTSAVAFFGDVTLSSTMTIQDGSGLMAFSSSGTQTLTTNGVTFRRPIIKNGTGTLVFSGDFTSGTGRGIEVTTGTLNSNNVAVSTTTFVASGTNAKTLQFGSSTWTITGSGTAWEANVASLTVVPGTGTVSMTSTSAKTFSGGGKTYGTLNQGGTGALTVSGSNTFASMTNTVQPATISLTAGTTTTVTTFTVSGTAGNLITLNSTSAGNRATLTDSGGVNSVSYMDIKDIAATGYGEWQAYTSNGNVDSGNNVGWVFAAPPPLTASEYQISLKSFTERRSF